MPLSFTGSLAPGSSGVQGDEVAFNPSTCQSVYAVGPIQGSASDTDGAHVQGEGTSSASGGSDGAAEASSASTSTVAFYMKTYYEDPVNKDVTSLRNDVEWNYTYGVCNNWYKWKRHAYWFTASGWQLDAAHDFPYFSCGRAESNSYAYMKNPVFCAGNTTWNYYYNPHYVWGGYHGAAHYKWNDDKAGGCTGLLSHHYTVGWETPW